MTRKTATSFCEKLSTWGRTMRPAKTAARTARYPQPRPLLPVDIAPRSGSRRLRRQSRSRTPRSPVGRTMSTMSMSSRPTMSATTPSEKVVTKVCTNP